MRFLMVETEPTNLYREASLHFINPACVSQVYVESCQSDWLVYLSLGSGDTRERLCVARRRSREDARAAAREMADQVAASLITSPDTAAPAECQEMLIAYLEGKDQPPAEMNEVRRMVTS
jgi:hypothetical protein